jgi:SIR2-like domain
MTEFLREQLRMAVQTQARKALVICGAGVSTQATGGRAPSWAKLIESGIKRVADVDSNAAEWAIVSRQKLTTANTVTWIAVADEVTDKLGGSHNAEFATWLEDEVGKLVSSRQDLLDAILALDCPIATTNYDDILVKASGFSPVIWDDYAGVHKVLQGERQGILHLHGHWRSPRRVVLGSKSYDEHFQEVTS